MAKEVLKLGDIVCSIDAKQSYRTLRNSKADFTLASEKPALISEINCAKGADGWFNCTSRQQEVTIRVNSLGAEILQMCTSKNTINNIASELSERHDYDDDLFREQVKTFLNIFKTYHLLEITK